MRCMWVFVASAALLAACESPDDHASQHDVASEGALAVVDGETITSLDLELAMREAGLDPSTSEDAERAQALEGLIKTTAMAHLAERDAEQAELRALDTRLEDYREQLLMRAYVFSGKHRPHVTEQEARVQYARAPERFGARRVRSYEWITTTRTLNPSETPHLRDRLEEASSESDWAAWASKQSLEGAPLRYGQHSGSGDSLQSTLRETLRSLESGTAEVVTVEGRLFLVRLVREELADAPPFEEVRQRVMRALEPIAYERAVEAAAADALARVEVEYGAPRDVAKR